MTRASSTWSPRFSRLHGVGIAVCAACVAGLVFAGVLPRANRDRLAAARAEDRRLAEAAIAAAESELEAVRAELAGYKRVLSRGDITLGTLADRNELLGRLAALASEHALRIDSIEPGAALRRPLYQVIPLTLSGGGSGTEFAEFHDALLADFADIAVRSFDLSASGSSETGSFRVELAWYLEPAGESAP